MQNNSTKKSNYNWIIILIFITSVVPRIGFSHDSIMEPKIINAENIENTDNTFSLDPAIEVTLKNGAKVRESTVIITMISLHALWKGAIKGAEGVGGMLAVVELHKKAQDSSHKYLGNTKQILESLSLVDNDGSINNITKDIILSAIEGEGLHMFLTSPVANVKSQ